MYVYKYVSATDITTNLPISLAGSFTYFADANDACKHFNIVKKIISFTTNKCDFLGKEWEKANEKDIWLYTTNQFLL